MFGHSNPSSLCNYPSPVKNTPQQLPKIMRQDEAGPSTFVLRGEYLDSLGTALKQEIARYNRIIVKMELTLEFIQRAIRGEVLMSEELDEQYTAMMNNIVRFSFANTALLRCSSQLWLSIQTTPASFKSASRASLQKKRALST